MVSYVRWNISAPAHFRCGLDHIYVQPMFYASFDWSDFSNYDSSSDLGSPPAAEGVFAPRDRTIRATIRAIIVPHIT